MEAIEKILKTMAGAGKPLSAGQIAEISGLERKIVDKAMTGLKSEGKIVSPKRCFWEAAK